MHYQVAKITPGNIDPVDDKKYETKAKAKKALEKLDNADELEIVSVFDEPKSVAPTPKKG